MRPGCILWPTTKFWVDHFWPIIQDPRADKVRTTEKDIVANVQSRFAFGCLWLTESNTAAFIRRDRPDACVKCRLMVWMSVKRLRYLILEISTCHDF